MNPSKLSSCGGEREKGDAEGRGRSLGPRERGGVRIPGKGDAEGRGRGQDPREGGCRGKGEESGPQGRGLRDGQRRTNMPFHYAYIME